MNFSKLSVVIVFLLLSGSFSVVRGQSAPDAERPLTLSAFGAATGVETGLSSGRNISLTGGVDLGVNRFRRFTPSIEVRGTYPFDKGSVDSLRSLLGGIRIARSYHAWDPYADVLYGRTQLSYSAPGYLNPAGDFLYTKSPSNLLSIGGGVDRRITAHFAIKADVQWQRYSTPVHPGGVNAADYSLGVVYRFLFGRHNGFAH